MAHTMFSSPQGLPFLLLKKQLGKSNKKNTKLNVNHFFLSIEMFRPTGRSMQTYRKVRRAEGIWILSQYTGSPIWYQGGLTVFLNIQSFSVSHTGKAINQMTILVRSGSSALQSKAPWMGEVKLHVPDTLFQATDAPSSILNHALR